jgi:hypothetical protein
VNVLTTQFIEKSRFTQSDEKVLDEKVRGNPDPSIFLISHQGFSSITRIGTQAGPILKFTLKKAVFLPL